MEGLWEFPGGKVNENELPETALVRELNEELGIDVSESCLAPLTFSSHVYTSFHLLMPVFACRVWRGIITPQENQELNWVSPLKLSDFPMPAADSSIVAFLRDFL